MASSSFTNMPSSGSIFTTYTQCAAYFMLLKSIVDQIIFVVKEYTPQQVQDYLRSKFEGFFTLPTRTSFLTLSIEEREGMYNNQVYNAAEAYLATIISPSVDRLKVSKVHNQKDILVGIKEDELLVDEFEGMQLTWKLVRDTDKDRRDQWFELCFEKRYKDRVIASYLPHVLDKAKEMDEKNKIVRLHAPGDYSYDDIHLQHPSTFDTLAMDPEAKKELMDDLDMFLTRRDFYKKVGKAWKRGYLLYGPPGTGKSSLIAAMANYLEFDVYDIELNSIHSDRELRSLLVGTENKSMIVIEDIDCGGNFHNRDDSSESEDSGDDDKNKVSLSGLLNFIDGLWSSCGEQRIIVFTTNYKDRLDPALLRPGRMDVHIYMGYCTPASFKVLANNYLNIQDHPLFEQIEGLIAEVEVTPAEIAEQLMKNNKVDIAIEGLVQFLWQKKNEKKDEQKEEDKQEKGQDKQEKKVKKTWKRLKTLMRRIVLNKKEQVVVVKDEEKEE